jgi:putative DNA primase/helicase
MKRATRIEARQIEFVWRKVIPAGTITVIAGRPGEGKSTLANQIACDVSQTHPVVFSNFEDPVAEVIVPRLTAGGAIMRRIYLPDEPMAVPSKLDQLERKIKQTGAKLVVFDAALQHLDVSAFSGQDVRKAITPLKAMLERTGAAALFVDHLRKAIPKNAHPLEALAGAGSGLPAAARSVWVFGRSPKNPEERVLAPVKVNNFRASHSLCFELEDRRIVTTPKGKRPITIEVGRMTLVSETHEEDASAVISFNGRAASSQDGTGGGAKKAIAAEYLTGLLMFGPKLAKEIEDEATAAGFSWATIRRAADAVGVRKYRDKKFQGQSFWALVDSHPALKVAARMSGQQQLGQP